MFAIVLFEPFSATMNMTAHRANEPRVVRPIKLLLRLLVLPFAAAGLTGGAEAGAQPIDTAAPGCPVAAWSWSRWNDPYGLNVAGFVQAVPGWTFAFDPTATVINQTSGALSEVQVRLEPRRIDRRHPPRTSDQHVYGYWAHDSLGVKPNWVSIRCGSRVLQRIDGAPRDVFHAAPPEPVPTVPPTVPPRSNPWLGSKRTSRGEL